MTVILGFPGLRHKGKSILPVREITIWSKSLSLEELAELAGLSLTLMNCRRPPRELCEVRFAAEEAKIGHAVGPILKTKPVWFRVAGHCRGGSFSWEVSHGDEQPGRALAYAGQ